jgi:hypothetical protein
MNPLYIAMDETPSSENTRLYGKRWGIEALFSDLKTRGFHVTKTQLKTPLRISRLLLVFAIAVYGATASGSAIAPKKSVPSPLKDPSALPSREA